MQARRTTEVASLPQAPTAQADIVLEAIGVLEVDSQGVGFLRSADYHYMPSPDDVYVAPAQIRNYMLKTGDVVEGKVRAPRSGEQYYVLLSIERINGLTPEQLRDRTTFEHLTPLFPNEQFKLSTGGKTPLACRMVDLFAPIGKGQRALIVAQPKTGKTILMKQIANAIAENYPDTYLMMLLIDERPEEVTDMARTVNAEVIAMSAWHRWCSKRPSAWSNAATMWLSSSTLSPALLGLSTLLPPPLEKYSPVVSMPPPYNVPNASSGPPATSKTAVHSPSSPPPSSTLARRWTR